MTHLGTLDIRRLDYSKPLVRVVILQHESSFLQSNTEVIVDGGEESWD